VSNLKNIHVFWWSSVKFEGKAQENFGDILSKYLVEKLSDKRVVWKHPKKLKWNPFHKKIYFTTGSVLAHVTKRCIVWGSGIISKQDPVAEAEFLAVRGPETYNYLKAKGYAVNKVFGDPAIVLPNLYNPSIEKTYKLGIIPHYVDYDTINNWYKDDKDIKVINLLNDDIEAVINDIVCCKNIISSSLHGVIVSQTYQISAVWVQFSKKLSGDNIKFVDYFRSVNIQPYTGAFIQEKKTEDELFSILNEFPNLPEEGVINNLRDTLMQVCPFKKS